MKADIMNEYSMPEIEILYGKIVRNEMYARADFVENVVAGIGGSFGGGKEVGRLISQMRR